MHLNQFPQDVQDFIYELCAKAILRAVRNGTFVDDDPENEKEAYDSL
ncbi:hypothetical protein [Paenibacillus polymyxa]|nr:hypothetical protein [Paenibacillus polymyxa]